ncbi:MAG: hypothetical protein FWF97_04945 [Alphaproteobacteria bacterium]|nr:hypothetical protein [Alphaproteobacteria bacterium]
MATPIKNFLYQQFTWLHIQALTDGQQTRLEKLIKDDQATKKQIVWGRYLHANPPNPLTSTPYEDSDGHELYKYNDYVDSDDKVIEHVDKTFTNVYIEENDWANLFRYFRDKFQSIDSRRLSIDQTFSLPWLNKWFGEGNDPNGQPKMFKPVTFTYEPSAKAAIIQLGKILRGNNTPDALSKNITYVNQMMGMYGSTKLTADIVNRLRDPLPEPTDTEFYTKFNDIITGITTALSYVTAENINNFSPDKKELYKNLTGRDPGDPYSGSSGPSVLDKIVAGKDETDEIDAEQIRYIKLNYPTLMFELFDKEKRQNDFGGGGPGGVDLVGAIKEAQTVNNYKDDEFNKIVPTYEDQKSRREQIKKDWSDFKEGTIDKLNDRHRRHIYSSQGAEAIVDAIYKLKIKPTDGLGKILSEQDKIKELLYSQKNANTAIIPQFNWGFKTLKEMQPGMEKAFEGALKDGRKMHRIVEELIQRAAREDKLEHCKTFLEVLSVMQYGPFTSAIRDKLFKETPWTFFGDLPSAKNNEALTFFLKTVDRVIKFGARVAFEGLNAGWRAFHRRGLSFGKEGRAEFLAKLNDMYAKGMADSKGKPEDAQKEVDLLEVKISGLQYERQTLNSQKTILKNDLAHLPAPSTADKQFSDDFTQAREENNQTDAARATAQGRLMAASRKIVEARNLDDGGLPIPQTIKTAADLNKEIKKVKKHIDALKIKDPYPTDEIRQQKQYHKRLQNLSELFTERDQAKSDFQDANAKQADPKYVANNGLINAPANVKRFDDIEKQEKDIADKKAEIDSKQAEITAKDEAINRTQAEKIVQEAIRDDREKNPKDKADKKTGIAEELTAYWDFLQSGISDQINPFERKDPLKKAMFAKSKRIIDGEEQEKRNSQWQFIDWRENEGYG